VRGGAQFLNLSGGLIGKIKVAHRLQFINVRAGIAAARLEAIGNARKNSELDLSLGTACSARGSVIRARAWGAGLERIERGQYSGRQPRAQGSRMGRDMSQRIEALCTLSNNLQSRGHPGPS
jgi:hypothetical protein